MKTILEIPKLLAIFAITLYQKTISPDHGWFSSRYPAGYCRHYPTCSEYGKQAIEKYGLLHGGYLAGKRIASCNPFVKPRIDLVP